MPRHTFAITVGPQCRFVVDVGSASAAGGVNVLGSMTDGRGQLDMTKSMFKTINGDITFNQQPLLDVKSNQVPMLQFPELIAMNGTLFIQGNPSTLTTTTANDTPPAFPTLKFPKLEYLYNIVFGSNWGISMNNSPKPEQSIPFVKILLPSLKAVGGASAVASSMTIHDHGPGLFCAKNYRGCLHGVTIGSEEHAHTLSIEAQSEDCRASNMSLVDVVVAVACHDDTGPTGVQEGLDYCPFAPEPVPEPAPTKPDPSMTTLYCDEVNVELGYSDIHECSVYKGTFTIAGGEEEGGVLEEGGVSSSAQSSSAHNDVYSVRRINGDLRFFNTEKDPITEEFVARFPYLTSINGTIEFLGSGQVVR